MNYRLPRGKFEHLVVKFLGWYEDRNFIFLTTEFVEHGDLAQYLKEFGPKLRSNAEEITRQLLEGLVVLHERGICHGNLKPQVFPQPMKYGRYSGY